VLDSQTVKAPHGPARGYDAAKKTVGRKRHIVVDTDGRLLMLNLTTADVSDSAGAQLMLDGVRKQWPWLKHLFADGAYARTKLLDKAVFRDFVLEIVRRSDTELGLQGAAPALGGGAYVRVDDALAQTGTRLRSAPLRLARDDPCRHGKPAATTVTPPMNNSQTDSDVADADVCVDRRGVDVAA